MTQKNYPEYYEHVKEIVGRLGHEVPQTMAGFSRMHDAATKEGALSTKVKELIALCIGIATHCDGCIASHVNDALRAGASRQEIVEAIGVAVYMGGGPSLMYGSEALEALDQFESVGALQTT